MEKGLKPILLMQGGLFLTWVEVNVFTMLEILDSRST